MFHFILHSMLVIYKAHLPEYFEQKSFNYKQWLIDRFETVRNLDSDNLMSPHLAWTLRGTQCGHGKSFLGLTDMSSSSKAFITDP